MRCTISLQKFIYNYSCTVQYYSCHYSWKVQHYTSLAAAKQMVYYIWNVRYSSLLIAALKLPCSCHTAAIQLPYSCVRAYP